MQFPGNLREWLGGSLVPRHRSVRGDAQRGNLCKIGNQLIGHSVSEVVVSRVAGQIFQWQHGNGATAGRGSQRFTRPRYLSASAARMSVTTAPKTAFDFQPVEPLDKFLPELSMREPDDGAEGDMTD